MSDNVSKEWIYKNLYHGLDRLATGFESVDPHISHECKMIAFQQMRGISFEVEDDG